MFKNISREFARKIKIIIWESEDYCEALDTTIKYLGASTRDLINPTYLSKDKLQRIIKGYSHVTKMELLQICLGLEFPIDISLDFLEKANFKLTSHPEDQFLLSLFKTPLKSELPRIERLDYNRIYYCNELIKEYNKKMLKKALEIPFFKIY